MTEASAPIPMRSAFEMLRSWILTGALAPGQRLPVRDLARGLGLSTMPVRQALVRLEEGGLVTIERNKGAVVSELSMDDLNDFYNLRQLLEPTSIRMGVERMTPERLARLEATRSNLGKALEGGDLVSILDLDEELLLVILGALANRQLNRVIQETWTRVRPYKLLFTTTAQVNAAPYIVGEDAALVDAAAAGDGATAHDVVARSLANAQLRLADLLRSHPGDSRSSPESVRSSGEPLATLIARLVDADSSAGLTAE